MWKTNNQKSLKIMKFFYDFTEWINLDEPTACFGWNFTRSCHKLNENIG